MLFRGLGDIEREGIGFWRVVGGIGFGDMEEWGCVWDWENYKILGMFGVVGMV